MQHNYINSHHTEEYYSDVISLYYIAMKLESKYLPL